MTAVAQPDEDCSAFSVNQKGYIGIKRVRATPMNRLDYNVLRKWALPADENGADEGYLVEYVDGGKPNMPHLFDGYVSWSPKDVFERAYCEEPTLGSIGDAILALKHGMRVARLDWEGRGTFLKLNGTEIVYASLNDDAVTPWLNATQEELLADDWVVLI